MIKTLLFLYFFATLSAQAKTNYLAVGETLELHVDPEERLWISDRSVLQAKDSGDLIFLKAKKTGQASYYINKKTHLVKVISKKRAHAFRSLQKATQLSGLKVQMRPNSFFVTGSIAKFQDWEDLAKSARTHNIRYSSQFDIPQPLYNQARKHFRDLFTRSHLPKPEVTFGDNIKVFLPNSRFVKRANQLLKPYGIHAVKSEFIREQMIELTLEFAQVAKSHTQNFGLQWPSVFDGQILSDLKKQLLLHSVETAGSGKILARPVITSKSGKPCQFHSGGELPVRTRGYKSLTVTWKKFGLTLDFTPVVKGPFIDLETQVDVTTPDGSLSAEGTPGFRRSFFSNHIQLPKNSSLLLTGFMQTVRSSSSEGLSWFRQIPLLSKIFAIENLQFQSSELLVFVTPRIIE